MVDFLPVATFEKDKRCFLERDSWGHYMVKSWASNGKDLSLWLFRNICFENLAVTSFLCTYQPSPTILSTWQFERLQKGCRLQEANPPTAQEVNVKCPPLAAPLTQPSTLSAQSKEASGTGRQTVCKSLSKCVGTPLSASPWRQQHLLVAN